MRWPFHKISTKTALQELLERTKIIMANIDKLITDVTKFRSDVADGLKRAQASIDALQAALASATLTTEQQAALDAADATVNAADATVTAFDVPAPKP